MKAKTKKSVINKKKQSRKGKSQTENMSSNGNDAKSKKSVKNSPATVKKDYLFVKGKSGNPNGRPKGSKNKFSVALLQQALQAVETRKRKTFLEKWVESAWGNANDMATIANFMLPKLKSIEQFTLPIDSISEKKAADIRRKLYEERFAK